MRAVPAIALFDPGGDVSVLAALHAASFDLPWDGQALAGLVTAPGTFAFHAPDGFVLARVAGDEAEILTLAVAPHARGRGLGRALMVAAANHSQNRGARVLFLEVGVSNPAALALYAGLGFEKVGTRKGYYGGPCAPRRPGANHDALVLRLSLPAKFA